jgi:iron complex outermembrane receptor protein
MQRMRLRSLLIMTATAAWWSSPAFASDATPDPAAPGATAATGATTAPGAKVAPANASNDSTELQEIVVTGLRASLERSLDTKRNAAVVMDSISATELGRFPDADVADSLSHIPGVTITRTTGGEGLRINVRGLGPDYNIVTLNNRILATDDDGRQLAFDVLPSELISSADVLKASQASALEGSIGGTVNLRTASSFDNPGFHGGAHAETNYNDMSQLHGNKFSAFVTDTNAAQTMGFVLGAVSSQTNTRTDSLNAYNQNIYGPTTYPFDGSGKAVPLAATPCCITFGSIFDDKKRDAFTGSLEWRPNEAFQLVADGIYTHLNDPQYGYNESYYFAANPDGTPWTNPVVKNGVVTAVTANNFQPEMVNATTNRQVDTWLYGLKATWKPADRWTLTEDVYRSKANRPEGGQDTFVTAGLVSSNPTAPDTLYLTDLPNSLPSLNVAVPPSQLGLSTCPQGTASKTSPGQCSYTALMNSGFLNNNKYWSTHYVGLNGYSVVDQVTGFTLDGSYDAGLRWVDKILFGFGESLREKNRADDSNDWTNGSGQYGTLYNTAGCPVQCNPYSFASQGFNVISMVNLPNFMQGAGGSYPTILPQLNTAQLLAFLRSLNGKPNPQFCQTLPCQTPFNFASTVPQYNPFNSYDVTERTFSLYGEALFSGSNWSGNVGLRIVRTKTSASTAEAVPSSLWTYDTSGSTQTWNVQYPTSQSVSSNGQYTLALPSANLSYWAVPDELQIRVGLAETMSRPNLSYLAPTSTNNAINGTPELTYNGTAGLRPIKATQADISAEWYYRPHSALTAAAFYKKIRDDIYTGTQTNVNLGTVKYAGGPPGTVPGVPFPWTVTAPANGASSDFYGIELAWQYIMDNGFGIVMEYTHTWNKSYDQNGNSIGAVNAVPPMTFSAGLFYEKGPITADINWDYADSYQSYCSQCTEVPGWAATASPFKWMTASTHYKFTKALQVYVEGKNLTNSVARTYLNGNPLLPWAFGQNVGQSSSGVSDGYVSYGRFYTLGMSYQF